MGHTERIPLREPEKVVVSMPAASGAPEPFAGVVRFRLGGTDVQAGSTQRDDFVGRASFALQNTPGLISLQMISQRAHEGCPHITMRFLIIEREKLLKSLFTRQLSQQANDLFGDGNAGERGRAQHGQSLVRWHVQQQRTQSTYMALTARSSWSASSKVGSTGVVSYSLGKRIRAISRTTGRWSLVRVSRWRVETAGSAASWVMARVIIG